MSRGARLTCAVAAAATAALVLAGCTSEEAGDIVVGVATQGTVVEQVEAPGAVTAKAAASVTAPASGVVAALEVGDGEQSEAGALVLRIASPQAEEQLRQAQQADAQAAAAAEVVLPGIDGFASSQRADARAREAFDNAVAVAETIEDETVQAEALARLAEAEADYATARADADRVVAQFNAGLASLGDALSSLAEAQRVQTQAAVEVAQSTVDALDVTSPISGTVTLSSASAATDGATSSGLSALGLPGDLGDAAAALSAPGGSSEAVGPIQVGSPVSAGQTLFNVTDSSTLSLTAEVDETDVLLVAPQTPATAELDALPGAVYAAEVASVDLAPNPSARGGVSYRVRLSLGTGEGVDGQPAPTPLPGMSAVVALTVREAVDVVTVPSAAVFRDTDGDAVWRVREGVARRQAVELGAQGEEAVEVISGLAVGDELVVSGADRVTEGQELATESDDA